MILAGRADRGLTDRCAAVVDRDNGVGPLVSINPDVTMKPCPSLPDDGHGSTSRHIPVRAMTTLLLSQTGRP